MSYAFSATSLAALGTAHPSLQRLAHAVADHRDCAVLCGHRGQAAQDQAYKDGKSRVRWPRSAHNARPAMAIDLVPSPINWNDRERFLRFGSFVCGVAAAMGIRIRWGGDWGKGWDMPHFELAEWAEPSETAEGSE